MVPVSGSVDITEFMKVDKKVIAWKYYKFAFNMALKKKSKNSRTSILP